LLNLGVPLHELERLIARRVSPLMALDLNKQRNLVLNKQRNNVSCRYRFCPTGLFLVHIDFVRWATSPSYLTRKQKNLKDRDILRLNRGSYKYKKYSFSKTIHDYRLRDQ